MSDLPPRHLIPGLPFSLVRFEEIDSTNRFLKDWGRQLTENGLVVVADGQTAGKGRLGRKWESARGEGLYFSLLISPVDIARATAIPLAAVVVLYDCIVEAFDVLKPGLDIKWPNDLLLEGRKVAGILAELEHSSTGMPFVVLGVGLNCNQLRFSADIPNATSLRIALGEPVDRDFLLEAFLVHWHRYLGGEARNRSRAGTRQRGGSDEFQPLSTETPHSRPCASGIGNLVLAHVVKDWKARSGFWKQQKVRFRVGRETIEGTTWDLGPSAGLVVRIASGELREVRSGEVEWIRDNRT
ncbi:MAG: biotin--[acetyl-CoA-carboxylase] ligase [Acidobacteria bacterium]|nr:biotin--[acetyl-CoA-carboxylase] ligase [Acidobacteriota bacterium]